MVADHEDLSRKGVRAAGHENLLNRPYGRRGRGIRSGAARSIAHEQDAGDARGTETIARSMPALFRAIKAAPRDRAATAVRLDRYTVL